MLNSRWGLEIFPAPEKGALSFPANNFFPTPAATGGFPGALHPMKSTPKKPDLCVLTRVIDDHDPMWDESMTLIDTRSRIREKFPNGIPHGWKLLKGKAAMRFLKKMGPAEARYRRDQEARRSAGNN